jgi:nucleotide-binding universal stress UspA family protein
LVNVGKILLPVSLPEVFERTSRRLVQQTAWLARRFQAEIVLLHVITPLSYPMGFLESGHEITARDLHAHVVQRAQAAMEQTSWPEFEGLTVSRELRRGDPAQEILDLVDSGSIGLIAMETAGYGEIYRFLMGSVTAKVLHECPCPVWTGAHLEEAPEPDFSIRRILCCLDLTPHNRRTLLLAAEMAAALGATLTLVHVTSSVEVYGPGGMHVDEDWKARIVGFAAEAISKLQREAGTNFDVLIDSGHVPQALNRAAERTQADVLVVGRVPGRSHLGDNGEGYGIIRQSLVPVLSV